MAGRCPDTWAGAARLLLLLLELVGNVSVTPPALAVSEGAGSAALTCAPVRGTVTWTKDGQSLDPNPRYRVSAGTLQISRPERNDSGTYNCTVSNPFSTGAGAAHIRVYCECRPDAGVDGPEPGQKAGEGGGLGPSGAGIPGCLGRGGSRGDQTPSPGSDSVLVPFPDGPEPPTIVLSSDRDPEPRRYVRVNSTVTLACRAPSDPPAQIYWSLADASDPLVPAQPELTLPRVQLSQAGLYSCLASNPQTQRQLRATLILTASLDPGDTVLLDLQCRGTYRPVEIAWARDGAPLGPGGRYRVSADGARLTISNFTAPQDLGGYSFPHGRESDPVEPPAPPSRASSRCSWGDGDLSFISYEEHLRIHGPPAPWLCRKR
ncbi:hypothetical protein KIL84_005720 [Mauremys mutica]|uniref:Ig-like domain-containing protein n=1 Tax=Mauremys mutica TaxID=74926 RepID=A0A9D4B482_9SAUR|nr:hypothetical protein KIL84_005720 [Mauremys mutica]